MTSLVEQINAAASFDELRRIVVNYDSQYDVVVTELLTDLAEAKAHYVAVVTDLNNDSSRLDRAEADILALKGVSGEGGLDIATLLVASDASIIASAGREIAVVNTGVGVYECQFTESLPTGKYAIQITVQKAATVGTYSDRQDSGFTVNLYDVVAAGATDAEFCVTLKSLA